MTLLHRFAVSRLHIPTDGDYRGGGGCKHRRQGKKTATQGDVMQKYALHRGQNHDTHAMGVAHGTTGSVRRRAEMEDN